MAGTALHPTRGPHFNRRRGCRAGLDLRIELADRDGHDEILAEWERSLDERERARLQAQGYRLVSSRG